MHMFYILGGTWYLCDVLLVLALVYFLFLALVHNSEVRWRTKHGLKFIILNSLAGAGSVEACRQVRRSG